MATRAILDVADAFLGMFGGDLRGLMLVAAIAGITLELIADMASRARHIVVLVEHKITVMRKGSRRPSARGVALYASAGDGGVQAVVRLGVTRAALISDGRLEEAVLKPC